LRATAYTVNAQSAILAIMPEDNRMKGARWESWDLSGDNIESPVIGLMRRVRVIPVKRGPKKSSIMFYYGCSDQLEWDPDRYQWNISIPLMNYTVELDRTLLKRRHIVPNVITRKW
jgi:hypothetical protein